MTNTEKDSSDTDEKPNFIIDYNKFCCIFCGNKYLSQTRCENHVRYCLEKDNSVTYKEVNGIPKFECKECGRGFKHLVGMKKHSKKHSLPGGFICTICGERYTSDAARGEHQKAEHKVVKQSKIVKLEISKPIKTKSDEELPEAFYCKKCGEVFRKYNIYQTHIKTKCGTEKKFKCEICFAKFLTKNTLYAHKQIHTGVKRHLCDYCGASFLSKGQLKVHERSHTGEKPFKCEICNKGFSYRESLVTHASVHTGIKPYACQACDLRFSCIGNLIKHRRARPDTCGLPKYQQNYKIAPRASTKVKQNIDDASTIKSEEAVERITSPNRDPSPPIFENPPTIKKFSETTISDQKPILYRIAEITPIDPQIIDLNTVGEIRSLKDENIIVTLKEDQDEAADDGEVDDDDSEVKLDETNEEYLQYIQSDENSGGGGEEEYVVSDWYDKGEEIEYVENENGTDSSYVLEIELQNPEQQEPTPNSIYTIIESGTNDECETFIIQTAPEKDDGHEVMIKYEKPENKTVLQDEENTPINQVSGTSALHKCTFCPQMYLQQNRLRNHLIVDHAQTDQEPENLEDTAEIEEACETSAELHKCPLCPKLYIQPIRLRNHLVGEHAAKDEFACHICHKWFESEDERIQHEKDHGENGALIHKCPTCDLYFASADDLDEHHSKVHFTYRCPKCSTVVDTIEALKAHNMKHHKQRGSNNQKNMTCGLCDRIFSTKVALSDHQRSFCGRKPLYKCDVCDKNYHSAGSLKTHKTVHSGILPFKCKYCGKVFRTKGQVKVHERQHSGEKPFKCNWCPKTFGYRESLLTHQSTHTGRKRFMCIPCGQRFSCISNLQSHRKSHILTCGQHPNFTKPINSTSEDVEMEILQE